MQKLSASTTLIWNLTVQYGHDKIIQTHMPTINIKLLILNRNIIQATWEQINTRQKNRKKIL